MKVKEIVSEEIKKGMRVIYKKEYKNKEHREDKVKTISNIVITTNHTHSHVVYDNGDFDYIFDFCDHYFEVVDDKPTGIPTFDGVTNQQIGGTHYTKNDPIQFAKDNYPPEHLEGFYRINVDKYMARYDKKNGTEDIKKAKHYIEMLLELKLREKRDVE